MREPINELDFKLYVVVVDTEDGRFEYEYSCLSHARERLQSEEQAFIMGYKNGEYYSVEQKIKYVVEKEYGKIEDLEIIDIEDNQITVSYLDCGYCFIDTITL